MTETEEFRDFGFQQAKEPKFGEVAVGPALVVSASGCSPPRLTTTQLPPPAIPLLVSGRLRLSLVDFIYVHSHERAHIRSFGTFFSSPYGIDERGLGK